VQTLHGLIDGLIATRRAQHREGNDLLSRLLAAQDVDGTGMTDQQLRDELVTLAFAGHKTTAAALTYCIYLLAQDPAADARLGAELDEVLAGRLPGAGDLPRLTYTEGVVKEAMRLYPPSWGIGREAVADCEVGGYFMPRGTQVLLPQYVVHRDPRWYVEPEQFRPERWEGDLEERLPRGAYFPFGEGPRVCIGGHFAMLETVLILATLAQRFHWSLVPGRPVRPVRLVPSITLWPRPGIEVVLHRRPGTSGRAG
jgi:cytochrome P450